MKKRNLNWIAESGLMIAIAVVLELLSKMFIPEMPFGGQITAAASLPIILIGWKYGIAKGLITGFAYALVEMAIGMKTIGAMALPSSEDYLGNVGKVVLMILLDYVLAYTVLGLGGLYKKIIKNNLLSLVLGVATVLVLRYLCHVVSGAVLFGSFAEWFFTQEGFPEWGAVLLNKYHGNALAIIYSLVYNAMYMLPETVFTSIIAGLVGSNTAILKKNN